MSQELYNDGSHICTVFRDLVTGEGIQANQFLIFDHEHAALIDPGGELTYSRLFVAISNYVNVQRLKYVLVSHQDPDVVSSVNKWLVGTDSKIVVPALWARFIPHLTRSGNLADRVITIPDSGINVPLGHFQLQVLPAHFLHAEGNFSFYDPVSRILFSGDIGANFPPAGFDDSIKKLNDILPYMEGFHHRYMSSNRVCRFWVNMIRTLEVDLIVPQHGRAFVGKQVVSDFLRWLERLECGIDLITQSSYRVPSANA